MSVIKKKKFKEVTDVSKDLNKIFLKNLEEALEILLIKEREEAYQKGYENGKKMKITGKWNKFQHQQGPTYIRCSICDEFYKKDNREYNFCPNCGADMRGDENEST